MFNAQGIIGTPVCLPEDICMVEPPIDFEYPCEANDGEYCLGGQQ